MIQDQIKTSKTLSKQLQEENHEHRTNPNNSSLNNTSSASSVATKQDDLETSRCPKISQQQNIINQDIPNPQASAVQTKNANNSNSESISKIIERLRPIVIQKMREMAERNKQPQSIRQMEEINQHRLTQYSHSGDIDQLFKAFAQPIRRCRTITFNQIIAVKKFKSDQSPSFLRAAVEYHQGLNTKQMHEINGQEQNGLLSPRQRLKAKLQRMRVRQRNAAKPK